MWLLSLGQQAPAAAGSAEPAAGTQAPLAPAVADGACGAPVSADQVTLEAIRDPASVDQLIRLEDARADRRRQEEQDSTTQYIRRLQASLFSWVLAVVIVTGCALLTVYSVGGLRIAGSRVLQAAAGFVLSTLVAALAFAVTKKIQTLFTGSPGADGAIPSAGRAGDARHRADPP